MKNLLIIAFALMLSASTFAVDTIKTSGKNTFGDRGPVLPPIVFIPNLKPGK